VITWQSAVCRAAVACKLPGMKMDSELARMAWQLVDECKVGLLTTADKDGWPHATWMNFQNKGYLDEIFTITAPNTLKVANLRANPRTEWMFSHPNFNAESIVYVTGETHIIEGDAVQPWWDAMPGKSAAFFRRYCESNDFRKFVALVTKVTNVACCCPIAYRKSAVLDAVAVRKKEGP